ncbi:WD-40 repeat-containing protein [Myxococcus stipitatus DSM 14675]|uniref:WD-40 repeat-containing protein n=1 Tax=Myxococcus stipitatus (strain DSM 14675 / JCM 12634 / Mx s8) TaxID=1278073 RepID=L7U2D4_MYXSD|nr:hypothetical protein [Myxococcus stipitatus]AGC42378.1 WD-40 repeat-containing protein [Myxococcus stipitatus DSM 14675]
MPSFTLTSDNASRLMRLRQFGPRLTVPGFRGQSLAFDAQGRHLASMGRGAEGTLQWWELRDDSPRVLAHQVMQRGTHAGFLAGGDLLVSLTLQGALQSWSTVDGTLRHELRLNAIGLELGMALQGDLVLVTSPQGHAFLWNARRGARVRELENTSKPLQCCALSPDGRLAVAGTREPGSLPGVLRFWETTTGAALPTLDFDAHSVKAMAFEPSGQRLAVATSENQIHLIEVATRKRLRTLEGPSVGTHELSFSPDGSLLAVACAMAAFVVLRTEDGKKLFSHWDNNDMQASSALFSPDGRTLVWGQGDGTVGVWGMAPAHSVTP